MTKYFNKITCLNPVAVQGRELKDLIFFNDNGVVFKANRGWLEGNGYPRRLEMENINLAYDGELKVKRVEKFNAEKVYLMNRKPDYFERSKYYVMYIHTDLIGYTISPDYYSSSMNHCYREYKGLIDGQSFTVHEHIDEPLQVQASDLKYNQFDEVKKKISLLGIKDDFRPLMKELEKLQNEYDKIQHEILKTYTLA